MLLSATCFADDSDSIAVCPNGHTTFKKIRIIYGHVSMSEELERKIEQGDVELGGCFYSEDFPDYRLYCKTCNLQQMHFSSSLFTQESINNSDFWWQKSENLKDFIHKFTPFIELMKSGFNYSEIEEYSQMFYNTTFVVEGLIMNHSHIDHKYVTQQALQYCKSKGIIIKESSIIEESQNKTGFTGCYKGNLIAIIISNNTVSISHMLNSYPGSLDLPPYMDNCQ